MMPMGDMGGHGQRKEDKPEDRVSGLQGPFVSLGFSAFSKLGSYWMARSPTVCPKDG